MTRRRPITSQDPEQGLLQRFRGGDRTAFQALIRPHLGTLRALARRATRDEHSADDLVQETLVRAVQGLESFRGESRLSTWLCTILMRLAGEPNRWQKAEPAASLGDLEIPDGLTPDEPVLGRELRDRLAEAMERLTDRQRAALHLRAAEGLDYQTIADVLGCSRGAARQAVLEARRRVSERMGRYLEP